MAKHAKLSASKTKQWSRCPGSIVLDEAHPAPDISGPAAQLGTAAHGLGEHCVKKGHEPEDYRGRLIEIVNPRTDREGTSILRPNAKWPTDPQRVIFEIDDDMIESVTVLTDYITRRIAELGIRRGNVVVEQWCNPLPHRDDTGGTADYRLDAWPDVLEIVDYKHGQRVYVPAKNNPQTRSYGTAPAREANFDYETIRLTIVQPRCFDAPNVDFEELTGLELKTWSEWLDTRADAVDAARADFAIGATLQEMADNSHLCAAPDGSHCTYCRHNATCPAVINQIQVLAAMDFGDAPEKLEAPQSPEMLGKVLEWAPFIKKWTEKAFTTAEALALRGFEIPGQKVVEKRTQRKYREDMEPPKLASGIAKEFGLKIDTLWKDRELKPMGEVEKMVERTVEPKERPEILERYETGFLTKPKAGLTIAPLDDKRPGVNPAKATETDFEGEDL